MNRRAMLQLLVLVTGSIGVALLIAFGLREMIPYEALRRSTVEERFFIWEAAMWLLGLLMLFFGTAAAIGSLDLARTRVPGLEEVYSRSHPLPKRRHTFSPLPWGVIATGAMLIGIAARARAGLDL